MFFRVDTAVDKTGGLKLEGPVMYLGNHPNGLIDPAVLLVFIERQVTFLAKEPLFRLPVFGAILRGMGALPVFRKQDGPGDTSKNEGTLTASVDALLSGRALTLFPEGKSHNEPQLAELKTGAARIALEAARQGAQVKLVPVGITYESKSRFKSRVHLEVGAPLVAADYVEQLGGDAQEASRRFTDAIADALRQVTLNLEAWEELPLLQTAEALYAFAQNAPAGDPERAKAFARAMSVLRHEQPERFSQLKEKVGAFHERLRLLSVSAGDLSSPYRPTTVALFVVRNLLWLAAVPVAGVGLALFVIPYFLPLFAVKVAKPDLDTESTVKLLTLMVLAPFWWALFVIVAWWGGGTTWALLAFLFTVPLALFTRYFVETRAAAWRDVRTFFLLVRRRQLRAELLAEATRLTAQVEALATELAHRVATR